MRFMLLMIPKGYENAPEGTMPDPERVSAMMKFNEDLQNAGVLLTLDGLHPPAMGARVSFEVGTPVVTDGPFAESKEVLGGYWMIRVGSKAEAVEWARRCPASANEVIEVRQVQEFEDFTPEVQDAAAGFAEMRAEADRTAKDGAERKPGLRYLSIYRSAVGEEGATPSPEHMAAMGELVERMTATGALIRTEPLAARARGAMVSRSGGEITVGDLSERAGGYAFLNAGSREEAIELCKTFLEVAGDGATEIRQVLEF